MSATAQAAPALDFSYFATDNIAFELIAATTRHEVSASGTALAQGGKVDVGSVWALPPALTMQYQFYAAFAGPAIRRVSFGNNIGPMLQAGIDYNFTGHWFANVEVKQIFLNTDAHVDALGTTLRWTRWWWAWVSATGSSRQKDPATARSPGSTPVVA